ncbi:MAG: hypothetical protein BGO70_03440 [Bacteroidetes bacterium 43-93]|nr:MAG: hypothetical protein BGO70_03440 [Bacteroidetes bacterium 43-93]
MCLKSFFILLLALEPGDLTAKASPGGKPIRIEHAVNTFQPYINAILIELIILLVLAVLILLKVQSIERSLKGKAHE